MATLLVATAAIIVVVDIAEDVHFPPSPPQLSYEDELRELGFTRFTLEEESGAPKAEVWVGACSAKVIRLPRNVFGVQWREVNPPKHRPGGEHSGLINAQTMRARWSSSVCIRQSKPGGTVAPRR